MMMTDVMLWKSMSSAPRDGTRILVVDKSGLVVIARHKGTARSQWRADGGVVMRPDPVCWMHVPEPPDA